MSIASADAIIRAGACSADGCECRPRRHGYRLLVVDTLSQFAGITGDHENSSGAALEAMQPLQEAAAEDLAVILSRHERKSGGEVGDSGRGSSAFSGAVDVVLSIRRGDGNTRETVRVLEALSRFDETPAELIIELADGEYRVLGTSQDVKTQEARERILEALPADEGEAQTLKDLCEATNVTRSTAQQVLDEYLAATTVFRIGAGKRGDPFRYWRPPEMVYADGPVVSAESNPCAVCMARPASGDDLCDGCERRMDNWLTGQRGAA